MLGLPAWGVKQGHGSFLTFEFGEPALEVTEWKSAEKNLRRLAFVQGRWHLWIYCCNWRAFHDGAPLAWSEDTNDIIGRAAATLNGQKLTSVCLDTKQGRSTFAFDLGGSLETWPSGEDATDEQWSILGNSDAFAYRADGHYMLQPKDTPRDRLLWSPFP